MARISFHRLGKSDADVGNLTAGSLCRWTACFDPRTPSPGTQQEGRAMTAVQDLYKNYINGQWVEGGAGTIAVDNPNTGEALTEQSAADAADVDRAVQAAKAVSESGALADLRPIERARMIQKMSAHISANKDRIAPLLTLGATRSR